MEQFTQTELRNLLVFLTTGSWNMKATDANELLILTQKLQELTKEKVEEVKEKEEII